MAKRGARRRRVRAAIQRASEKTIVQEIVAPTPKTKGLRAIAVFEAVKGLAVLAAGFGLLALVHRDVEVIADRFVRTVGLNPASHYPRILLEAASHVTDARLVALAVGAAAYATVRLVEAYGLWQGRAWAEWFAILSGGLYLPVEIYELLKHPSWVKGAVLLGNVLLVVYLLRARRLVAHEVVERSRGPVVS